MVSKRRNGDRWKKKERINFQKTRREQRNPGFRRRARKVAAVGRRAHLAPVSPDEVAAGGAVLAGVGRALVQLLLAVAPRVAQGALAVVRVAGVDADAGVLAQAVGGHACGSRRRERRHGGARGTSGPGRPMSRPTRASGRAGVYSAAFTTLNTRYISKIHRLQGWNMLRFI